MTDAFANRFNPRWKIHGSRDDTLILIYSIEEGPLAEIVCHGEVDPLAVVDALNEADVTW